MLLSSDLSFLKHMVVAQYFALKLQALHAMNKDKESAKILTIQRATAQYFALKLQAIHATTREGEFARKIITQMACVL